MVHIQSSNITPRLRYIVHLLFDELLGVDALFVTSEAEYEAILSPKFRYGMGGSGEGPRMPSVGLLDELGIAPVEVPVDCSGEMPVLFPCYESGEVFPFDLFSAAFYLVSRFEEYVSTEQDRYGRFEATASIAWRHGFLDKPVINIWVEQFVAWLQRDYPGFQPRYPAYCYTPTLDIDHAYAYRFRSLKRTIGGSFRSLLQLNLGEFIERYRVLMGWERDPFDTYAWVRRLHAQRGQAPVWFILTANNGGDDNNISPTGRGFARLTRGLHDWSEIGLHPSLGSYDDPGRLASEVEILAWVAGVPVRKSRQHFLRFSLPDTYRALINVGITDDYSMGYATHTGFRAGIARSYYFFDLVADAPTSLRIHPLPLMDVTLRDYLRLNPKEALDRVKSIVDATRLHRGELITLWHNESLSGQGRWKGWRELYEEVVALASEG